MTARPSPRSYPIDSGEPKSEPNYTRVVRSLSEEDLEAEILSERGERGYRLALLAEDTRRAQALYPPEEK